MSSQKQEYVEFVGVNKSYDGESLVIQGLDLSIGKGEFLTMLGPSGSGKTTSLMMLAGFEAPSQGEIRLNGRQIQNVPPHKRNIGMVFQNYALFPHMTVTENLAYPLQARRVPKSDVGARVDRALDMVQMRPFASRKPAQLSGGQQQRVALARALVFEPDLVLMDEPLGALDKNLREHMQYEIKRLHDRLGITVVYVTHDQSEALTMSDRIAVFNRGRIEQLATPSRLYEEPETVFVAGFIGENNTLPGRLVEREGTICTVEVEGGEATVRARALATPSAGSRVVLSIRPERLRLVPRETNDRNGILGRVSDLIYHGDHIRAHLTAAAGATLVAKLPNTPDRPMLQVGDECYATWLDIDCLVLATT